MRILICEDHKIVRDGLKRILLQLENIEFLSEAGTGEEVLQRLKNEHFDLVLLDISLPGISGLDVLQTITEKWPEIKVLMLSMFSQAQYAIRALSSGASGYLTKDSASEELLLAVKRVISGEKYVASSLAAKIAIQRENFIDRPVHEILSNREFEIMVKLANGRSLLDIGNELAISNKTVSTYRTRIMEKMKMSNNAELTKYCIENQLVF